MKKNPSKHPKTMSGAEFKARMKGLLDDLQDTDEVFFGAGDLSVHRFKNRGPVGGPKLMQIEFNEVYSVALDPHALD